MHISIDFGDIIAAMALLLAIYSSKKTNAINKLQKHVLIIETELNELLLEKEKSDINEGKRADLSANFIRVGTGKLRLKIFNKGKGIARNIRLEIPDDIEMVIRDDKFPLESLEYLQSVELVAAAYMGSPSKIMIKLTWDDDTKINNVKEVYVTL